MTVTGTVAFYVVRAAVPWAEEEGRGANSMSWYTGPLGGLPVNSQNHAQGCPEVGQVFHSNGFPWHLLQLPGSTSV